MFFYLHFLVFRIALDLINERISYQRIGNGNSQIPTILIIPKFELKIKLSMKSSTGKSEKK